MSNEDKAVINVMQSEVQIKGISEPGSVATVAMPIDSKGDLIVNGQRFEISPEQLEPTPKETLTKELEWYESYLENSKPHTAIEEKTVEELRIACEDVRNEWQFAGEDPYRFALLTLRLAQSAKRIDSLAKEQFVATGKRMRKTTLRKQKQNDKDCAKVEALIAEDPNITTLQACKIAADLSDHSYKTIERECKKRGIQGALPRKGRPKQKK